MRINSSGMFDSRSFESFMGDLNSKIIAPLYHYTSSNAADLIYSGEIIWLSKFDNSNDELEFRHGILLAAKIMRKEVKSNKISKVLFEKFLLYIEQEGSNPKLYFSMACFSKSSKSRYLWWKYAQKRKGKCLEFHFVQNDVASAGVVVCRSVFYSKIRLRKLIRKIVHEYTMFAKGNFQIWKSQNKYEEMMGNLLLSAQRDIFTIATFYKRRKFRHEKEYRLTSWITGDDQRVQKKGDKQIVEMNVSNSLRTVYQYT